MAHLVKGGPDALHGRILAFLPMPLFARPDGTVVRDLPLTRRIMPFIMPTRTESAVYFEQEIDLSKTLPFLARFTARTSRKVTVFHLFLWAAVRAFEARPRLNRFVSGGHVYDRDGVWISYSAKKALRDDAPIVVLKRRFTPGMTFEELVELLLSDLVEGRSDKKSHVDRELGLFLSLPGPILSLGVRLLRWLDGINLLPGSFIHPDPMYASLFVANLGSVRLESAFHHLYEYGTIPLFAAIGRTKKVLRPGNDGTAEVKDVCSIKYTFDERIEDGLYCATALEILQRALEDPEAHGATIPEANGTPAHDTARANDRAAAKELGVG
jgi:hypothetical protein